MLMLLMAGEFEHLRRAGIFIPSLSLFSEPLLRRCGGDGGDAILFRFAVCAHRKLRPFALAFAGFFERATSMLTLSLVRYSDLKLGKWD